jgi:hypothetical protein
MRMPRTVQPLPRYVRRKWLKGQSWAYFFEPPTWARKDGCPVRAEALGRDYQSARDSFSIRGAPVGYQTSYHKSRSPERSIGSQRSLKSTERGMRWIRQLGECTSRD